MGKVIAFFIGAAILAIMAMSFAGIATVDEGNRGVKKVFGKVAQEELTPGIYFYNPFTTSVEEMSVRTQKFENKTTAYTKDVQQAELAYTLNYSLDPTKAVEVYATVGKEYASVLIPQIVEGALKNEIGHWEAVELVNKREEAIAKVQDKIITVLAARGIRVERLELPNVDYRDEFEHAVENKVIAIQSAEESRNKTVRIQEEANQKIISAKAEAETIRITAEALKENKDLVTLRAVQRWDGKMPQYMMGGDALPFIQLPSPK